MRAVWGMETQQNLISKINNKLKTDLQSCKEFIVVEEISCRPGVNGLTKE